MLSTTKTNPAYARIIKEDTYIYKEQACNTVMFELPNTYFVKLLDYKNNIYKVEYCGIIGYVKEGGLQPVVGTPKKPFMDKATFRIFSSDGAVLRNTPTKTSTITTTLPIDKAIVYLGSVVGEELIYNRGNVWYYAVYTKNNETCTGYVYAGLCDMLTNVDVNTESLDSCDNPFVSNSESYIQYLQQNDTIKTLLIVAVCLPSVMLVYLLFKPLRLAKSQRLKKDDYFEDNEL